MREIYPLGDSALIISFNQEIAEEINKEVMHWADVISQEFGHLIRFVSPAYCSLTVGYKVDAINFEAIKEQLCSLNIDQISKTKKSRILRVPVCYEGEFAPDLEEFARMKGKTPREIIQLHTSKAYRVYMLGFVPGFVYLGKVDTELYAERKDIPLTRVPSGSVGLAGWQTGIYPSATPGGWHLIGRTPVPMLLRESHPSPFRPGDCVFFYPIDSSEFNHASIHYDA